MNKADLHKYMTMAILLARRAASEGERPFGCVVVNPDGDIVGTGAGSDTGWDPTRHSEMIAIREACAAHDADQGPGHDYLRGWTLFSTHEPCIMCTGAIIHAHISQVVWGSSRSDLPQLFSQNPTLDRWRMTSVPPLLIPGILQEECVALFDAEVLEADPQGQAGPF